MSYNTENASLVIDKYMYDTYSKEEGFLKHILGRISFELSERIMDVLDSHKEVVIKQSNVEAINNYRTCQVEFNGKVEWMPLVRCVDCKWFQCNMSRDGILPRGVPEYECRHWCGECDPTDYCSYAERRKE